ncbi:MAG: MFS transporter [Candidatus Cloacimonetes bacterium]|nr:MFS transporter [Candidatus Cloacimonadota bacterium]
MAETRPTKIENSAGEPVSDTQAKKAIKDTLTHSIRSGGWHSVMLGFGESYISAFAEFLNASAYQLGIIGSVPLFIASILQLAAVKLTNIFESRKRIVLFFYFAQVSTWIFILTLSYFFRSVWLLIFLVVLFYTFGSFTEPAWWSWMGDIVEEKERGKYFGKKNRVAGFASLHF